MTPTLQVSLCDKTGIGNAPQCAAVCGCDAKQTGLRQSGMLSFETGSGGYLTAAVHRWHYMALSKVGLHICFGASEWASSSKYRNRLKQWLVTVELTRGMQHTHATF